MATIGIAVVFSLLLCGVALWANARFRSVARLPMQWWLTGEVIWTAPRVVALALLPVLAVGVLAPLSLLSLSVRPRAGQEWMELPSLIAIGSICLGIQLFHLWLIERTIRRDDR